MDPSASTQSSAEHENHIVETLQQLVVAFVLAMTFRGFVAEGFVIPTGSMAPTLMGQHLRTRSPSTGVEFAVGLDAEAKAPANWKALLVDPMLGPGFEGTGVPDHTLSPRMGDRIFVVKSLYPFAQPDRFDVVVFKNPTDPTGPAENYIKRLIGLPGETIWLADGDVFARGENEPAFRIQRKPEHVQRAVWQNVYNSDYAVPTGTSLRDPNFRRPEYAGPPWSASPDGAWTKSIDQRSFRCEGGAADAGGAELLWQSERLGLTDWTPYNMLSMAGSGRHARNVSDVRVAGAIVRDSPSLTTTLRLATRRRVFEFVVSEQSATVRIIADDDEAATIAQASAEVALPGAGRVFDVEFWHVDQALSIFIDGERVVSLEYEWSPEERLRRAAGIDNDAVDAQTLVGQEAREAKLSWRFEGSPCTLHRIRVDRDLHYRFDRLAPGQQKHTPYIHGNAFGTSLVNNVATLGPDHFMMLGDNSAASLDSRLWGRPHPIVAAQIDDAPFVVNRKLLLGKAWVVYFPSPLSVSDGGRGFIPDFGRLRFIR